MPRSRATSSRSATRARPEQGPDLPLSLAARPDRLPPGGALSVIEPAEWPILVTGASGFLGGHVARGLARAGHPVRGLARRRTREVPGDPSIEWTVGDLRSDEDRRRALRGVRGVIHAASWVHLGSDPRGEEGGERRGDPGVAGRRHRLGGRAVRLHLDPPHPGRRFGRGPGRRIDRLEPRPGPVRLRPDQSARPRGSSSTG